MSAVSPPGLAIFDFDKTLIAGDSLFPFLLEVGGWARCAAALAEAGVAWFRERPSNEGYRTFIKSHMLRSIMTGRRQSDLGPILEKLCGWAKWLEPSLMALKEHHAAGRRIVIASGGLDLYLPALLRSVPYDILICTQMEVCDGIITGVMANGNCVRARKAALVAEYINENGPFGESWGYGNYPHDVPMLALVQHRILV